LQGTVSKVVRTGASGFSSRYVGLVGLGKAAKLSPTSDWGASCYQALGSAIATTAKAQRIQTAAVAVLDLPGAGSAKEAAVAQIATGALLGAYESSRFKSKPSPTASRLSQLHILSGKQALTSHAPSSASYWLA
jgi:leucyl aminopeptidase